MCLFGSHAVLNMVRARLCSSFISISTDVFLRTLNKLENYFTIISLPPDFYQKDHQFMDLINKTPSL